MQKIRKKVEALERRTGNLTYTGVALQTKDGEIYAQLSNGKYRHSSDVKSNRGFIVLPVIDGEGGEIQI